MATEEIMIHFEDLDAMGGPPRTTLDPPNGKKNDPQSKTAGRYLFAARDPNPKPAD
jgi:hypothetical protein